MQASRSFYRVLLRLCPPDLRAEYGAEMSEMAGSEAGRAYSHDSVEAQLLLLERVAGLER